MRRGEKKGFMPEFVADFVRRQTGFVENPDLGNPEDSDPYKSTSKSVTHTREQEPIGDDENPPRSFGDILKDIKIRNVLFTSNIFILGKIGYFDRVIKQLTDAYQKYEKRDIPILRTEPELIEYKQGLKDKSLPVVFIPAARSRENLSHLVTLALEMHVPLWMVALPSHFETQLLLSFKSLFIAMAPETELQPLFEIMDIQTEYKHALLNERIKAVLLVGSHIGKRNKSNEFGYTIAISSL